MLKPDLNDNHTLSKLCTSRTWLAQLPLRTSGTPSPCYNKKDVICFMQWDK